MSANSIFNTTTKLANALIRRADGSVLSIPSGSLVLKPGVSEDVMMAPALNGLLVAVGKNSTKQVAIADITWMAGQNQAEIWEQQLGLRFGAVTKTVTIMSRVVVPLLAPYTIAAASTGTFGYGMVADTAVASTKSSTTGLSVPMTRIVSTGSPAPIAGEFAQAANGAWTFNSADAGKIVTFSAELVFSGTALTETLLDTVAINALVIDTQFKLWNFTAELASPNLDGQALDFGAKEVKIPYTLLTTPSSCQPYTLEYLAQLSAC
jgi:hypothetical protein